MLISVTKIGKKQEEQAKKHSLSDNLLLSFKF